jgi:TatD DNase family protein
MIDTHCHLTDPSLSQQLPGVLARAQAAGVDRMITIGTDLDDDKAAMDLCRKLSNVRCAIGVHPNYTSQVPIEDLPRLRELQADPSVLALGEMGLDFFRTSSPVDRQRQAFAFQLELAVEVNKPVVIHARDAIQETLDMMRGFPAGKAVFHCFTGTVEEAQKILEAGFFLGFTGAVTYKKGDAIRAAAKLAPLDRIFVETDAPYLSPEPMRKQKINEPSLVVHVGAVVAREKGLSVEELDRATTSNARAFFGWE